MVFFANNQPMANMVMTCTWHGDIEYESKPVASCLCLIILGQIGLQVSKGNHTVSLFCNVMFLS